MKLILRPVTSATQMSNADGLVGTIVRSAVFTAASAAGDSSTGVSITTSVTFRFAAAVNADERRANASVRTGNLQSMRLEPHRMAQLLGSKSKIMTLSPASWAAAARQVASVVLPHPPLCVANTMVRIEKILSINEMSKSLSEKLIINYKSF
jgi:hypothetical protein